MQWCFPPKLAGKPLYGITDKSFPEALILAATNPQYVKRFFIELPVEYMKIPSSELVVHTNVFFVFALTFRTI